MLHPKQENKMNSEHSRRTADCCLFREHYGRPVAGLAALLLIISNVALIAADLAAFSQ
jgi:hypothetical protein